MNVENEIKEHVSVPKLLTVNDVAKLLKLSTRSIWRLVAANAMAKPIRIGGSIRWRESDVTTWLASIPLSEKSQEENLLQNQMIDLKDHATIQSRESS